MAVRVPFRRGQTCLLRAAQLDVDAFADFYDAYARRVLTYFARRVFDAETALDLTSETFAVALERRRQFRGRTEEEEQGWLFAIAHSQLAHLFRRGAVERTALRKLAVEVPSLSDEEIERIEILAGLHDLAPRIQEALHHLPAEQHEAVELRVIEELSYAEIASVLGVTQPVVRQRVSRGLRALAIRLGGVEAVEGAA